MNQHQILLKPDPGKHFFLSLKKELTKTPCSTLILQLLISLNFLALEWWAAAANQHIRGEQFGNAEYSSGMLPKEQQFHRSAIRNQESRKAKPKSFHVPIRYWTIFNILPIVRYLIDTMNMLSFHGWLLINMLKLIQYIWFRFKKGWNLCLIFLALHAVNQKNKTDVKITAPLYCLVPEP